MKNNTLKTTAKMAVAMGLFLPAAETVRRFNQLLDPSQFISWFDDYMLGAVLLWAGYLVFKNTKNSVAYLIAAYGIGTGAVLISFLGQFYYYQTATGDPGIFSTTFVLIAKGVILLYLIVGLRMAIKANMYQE